VWGRLKDEVTREFSCLKSNIFSDISDTQGDEYEDDSFLGFSAV
jgi:hypothetical protein